MTAPTTVPCDSCYGDTPATRELHLTADAGTRDEHGISVPLCERPTCLDQARRAHLDPDNIETDVQPLRAPRPRTVQGFTSPRSFRS